MAVASVRAMGRHTTTPRHETAPARTNDVELVIVKQVFETWWIELPAGFEECWVDDGGYRHAWDAHRSISLSSTVLIDSQADRPASTAEILDQLTGALEGEPIDDLPVSLLGGATIIPTDPAARASRAVTGYLAVDGRVLTATITSDDIDWAKRIWRSIGSRPAPIRPAMNRAARRAQRHRSHARLA